MRIANRSKVTIECRINGRCVCIEPGTNFDFLEDFETITFVPYQKSYSVVESGNSKILKVLSFFDDPFNLVKEYHLTVESSFAKESIGDFCQINITMDAYNADVDTRVYYDYTKVEVDGVEAKPNDVIISAQTSIQKDFIANNKKLAQWQTLWDIIIEPLFFEIIGYYAVYRIFSVWFGANAWKLVLLLLVPNILFEVFALLFKKKKYQKRTDKFLHFFNSNTIYECCYSR